MIRRVPASPRPPVVRGHATPGGQAARHPKPFPKRLPPPWTADSWHFWKTYRLEGDEPEDFSGLYHVTMNLPGVLKTGRLLPRRDLLQKGWLVGGLGGGPRDMAPDAVSAVPALDRAQVLARTLRVVLLAVQGRGPVTAALQALAEAGSLDEITSEVEMLRDSPEAEDIAALGQFDAFVASALTPNPAPTRPNMIYAHLRGFERELLRWRDFALCNYGEESDSPLCRRAPIGLTAPWEVFARAQVDDIAVLQLAARQDARPGIHAVELELRFRPEDVRLLRVLPVESDR